MPIIIGIPLSRLSGVWDLVFSALSGLFRFFGVEASDFATVSRPGTGPGSPGTSCVVWESLNQGHCFRKSCVLQYANIRLSG